MEKNDGIENLHFLPKIVMFGLYLCDENKSISKINFNASSLMMITFRSLLGLGYKKKNLPPKWNINFRYSKWKFGLKFQGIGFI